MGKKIGENASSYKMMRERIGYLIPMPTNNSED